MYVRRKVFSNVEQPVEEQLYSVDMTETEYALFSAYMDGYKEAMFSRLGGYDVPLSQAKAAAGDMDIHAWAKSKEGQKWLKANATKAADETKAGVTQLKGNELKQARKDVKDAANRTKDVNKGFYHPSNNAGGKSAKAAAETIAENPDKFKDVVRKADMKRWVGKNKKALALGAAGTAALGAGAGYYAYNK